MKRFLLLVLVLFAAPAFALEVGEPLWGFNGKPVPGVFNVFSVFVNNPGSTPYQGEISLYAAGYSGREGVRFVEPLFLAPNAGRWVQFYPYLERAATWKLSWGRGPDAQAEAPEIKFGPPAQVLFADPNDPLAGSAHFKIFPENLFPVTVAATDGLAEAVLDHAPRWEPARREAFLDWLRRGGILHLLQGPDGKFPEFPEDLSVLNANLDFANIGSGRIYRHPLDRRLATGESMRESARKLAGGNPLSVAALPSLKEAAQTGGVGLDLGTAFTKALSELTRPTIRWGLIYLLAFGYLCAIGPWHYFWGRKRKSLVVIGALAACVAIFGFCFMAIGRRGYGEISTTHAIAWARPLGGGRCDVEQWSTVFVTHGDMYKLHYPSPHNLYTALDQNNSSINGSVTGANGGEFEIDIPRFSSRAFLHHAVLQGDDPAVQVTAWAENEGKDLDTLSLTVGSAFPKEVTDIWVRHRFRIYRMKLEDGKLELTGANETEADFFERTKLSDGLQLGNYFGQQHQDREAVFKNALRPLMSRITGIGDALSNPIIAPPLPAGRAQLFIYAKNPPGFYPTDKEFSRGDGCVLYDQFISKPQP